MSNLQRKILKQEKNWRLDGELVHNPDDQPQRFDELSPDDIAVFEFNEGIYPTTLRAVFAASSVAADTTLHTALNRFLGLRSMSALTARDLEQITRLAGVPQSHPIYGLALSDDLENVVSGDPQAIETLLSTPNRPKWSAEDLRRANERASRTGSMGEQLVNDYLQKLKDEGTIIAFEWVSSKDAISPYDFWITYDGTAKIFLDVKSTSSVFERPFHVSTPELRQMVRGAERYDIYRVVLTTEESGKLRIATDVASFAQGILATLSALPDGVIADGVTISPSSLAFDPETIELSIIPAYD
jgi:hypothetical protein